jgi:phenylalanine-4-hydroxylase
LEGDSNTKYFYGTANGRHRKIQDEGLIEDHEQLKSYITNYYKGLFGSPEESSFSLDETQTDDILPVSMEENGLLITPYSEDEVRTAIFLMEHNKAPEPGSFPAEFYQTFWDTIKSDLLQMFSVLYAG